MPVSPYARELAGSTLFISFGILTGEVYVSFEILTQEVSGKNCLTCSWSKRYLQRL